MRLRQIALVARDLEPVVEELCSVLGLEVCFRDPGVGEFGLHNALMAMDDTFLEVVSPEKDGTAAGRLLERRNGDGGYMALFQTADLAAERPNIDALGIRVVWSADFPEAKAHHLHPRDIGGAIVSIDQMTPPESWKWGGPDWGNHIRTERIGAIAGAELQADDPKAMAERWASVLRSEAVQDGDAWNVPLDGGVCRFVPDRDGRGEGISSVIVTVNDRDAVLAAAKERGLPYDANSVTLCGTRFQFAQ